MRSVRSLMVAAATIIALSACGTATASPTPFTLDKTCVPETKVCTVVSSDITWFPAGTEIAYTTTGDSSTGLLVASITVDRGATVGVCDFNYDGKPLTAKCKFTTGSGDLTGFHLLADVTVTPDKAAPDAVWHWVGTYWFGD